MKCRAKRCGNRATMYARQANVIVPMCDLHAYQISEAGRGDLVAEMRFMPDNPAKVFEKTGR